MRSYETRPTVSSRAPPRRRHVAAAGWIESLPEDRAEDRAETLAHHYVTAIELYRAAGEDVPELRANAFPALQEAGERSLLLHAYRRLPFLEQALDLLRGARPDCRAAPDCGNGSAASSAQRRAATAR